MKRILKILGLVIGAALIIILAFAAYIHISGIPSYPIPEVEYQVKVTPEGLENGKKIVSTLCASCHRSPKTGLLTGKLMKDAPEEFGTIYSRNITRDPVHGIGEWTPKELLVLLRTGIKRDGQYAPPYMAKLPLMADDDINDIIAFLTSDDPMIAAVPQEDPACEPSFLTKLLSRVAFKPFPMPEERIPLPDTTNTLAWGEYLAHNYDCFPCHSADFKTVDYLNPTLSPGYFGGGNAVLNMERKVRFSRNLTPDDETGIGKWSKERFINAVKYGKSEEGPNLQYPMLPYPLLADAEIGAIYEYLRTIPPISNDVKAKVSP